MCARSVKRPVKSCAKGGYSNQPPPTIPPEQAFHPAICVWGLVCVCYLFIEKKQNIQQSTLKCNRRVDDWCCLSSALQTVANIHTWELPTATATFFFCLFFFIGELYGSYWRWGWEWETQKSGFYSWPGFQTSKHSNMYTLIPSPPKT